MRRGYKPAWGENEFAAVKQNGSVVRLSSKIGDGDLVRDVHKLTGTGGNRFPAE